MKQSVAIIGDEVRRELKAPSKSPGEVYRWKLAREVTPERFQHLMQWATRKNDVRAAIGLYTWAAEMAHGKPKAHTEVSITPELPHITGENLDKLICEAQRLRSRIIEAEIVTRPESGPATEIHAPGDTTESGPAETD